MLSSMQAIIIITLMAFGTAITRFLPFLMFRDAASSPRYMKYLGKMLPAAAVGLLVVYCLRYVQFLSSPHGLPETISILVVAFLHIWKKNTLLSVLVGTICYMLLVQLVLPV